MVIFSDGLAEVENPQGEAFDYRQVLSVNKDHLKENHSRVATLKNEVVKHIENEQGHDDISLLAVCCD